MSNYVPRFLRFEGYKTIDVATSIKQQSVVVKLEISETKPFNCHVCGTPFARYIHTKIRRVKDLSLRGFTTEIVFPRRTGECLKCQKQRVEEVDFVSPLSPHYTVDYSWWLGEMCEFATVKRGAEFAGVDNMSLRRIDFNRMRFMMKNYKIPYATRISVDEVYARSKSAHKRESRNKRFFTVITDLDTRKVIWVSPSRDQEALDQFFTIVGDKFCKLIEVIAMDQHEPYRASAKKHCPHAVVVWDKFHLVQNFNEAANELRKDVFSYAGKSDEIKKLARGKYRYIFLKKSAKRTEQEKMHLEEAMKQNWYLSRLELIKERFHQFFTETNVEVAWKVFDEIGDWVHELEYPPLIKWWENLEREWDTLKNYFHFRVTSALSEGINNVIKSLKRQAFGYRNMEYFQLKILQRCGYLNSQHMPAPL